MNDERRVPDKYGRWLPILFPILVACVGVVSVWTVNAERLSRAESDIMKVSVDVERVEAGYTPREILDLQMITLRKDIENIKESMERIEKVNWEILKKLRESGGHTQ